MGPAPYNSGWFGRGKGDSAKYKELNQEYLQRPARKQKDRIDAHHTSREGDQGYNIWYGKCRGENWSTNELGMEPAENRCVVATDAGYTEADKGKGGNKYFCIQFARGKCAMGVNCRYYHRVPTLEDDAAADRIKDCFGREKHRDHKDDMGGTGSYEDAGRTLYVGRLRMEKYKGQEGSDHLQEVIEQQFSEFGELEHVNVVIGKAIAFVRYRHKTAAEFAKEAMSNQGLGKGEVLNVRWARDDPNPIAKEAAARANMDAAIAAVSAVTSTVPSFEDHDHDGALSGVDGGYLPNDYIEPKAKRLKVGDEIIGSYPDTDSQYAKEASA